MYLFKYALFLIPAGFFWLSFQNQEKLKKLKSTGRIPDMEAANRNVAIFSIISVITLAATVYIIFNK